MNFKLLSYALAFSVAAVACSGAEESTQDPSAHGEESEQDLTTAGKQIAGAWHVTDANTLDAYVFYTDGTFLHDQTRILNGVLIMGGPPPGRDIGKYAISAKNKTLTLTITGGWHAGSKEVFSYEYTPAPVLNGVFLPGHEPAATLVLRAQPAPGSHVAYPAVTYKSRGSWCNGLPNVGNADCAKQRAESLWTPASGGAKSTCDVASNSCKAAN